MNSRVALTDIDHLRRAAVHRDRAAPWKRLPNSTCVRRGNLVERVRERERERATTIRDVDVFRVSDYTRLVSEHLFSTNPIQVFASKVRTDPQDRASNAAVVALVHRGLVTIRLADHHASALRRTWRSPVALSRGATLARMYVCIHAYTTPHSLFSLFVSTALCTKM